MKNHFLCCVSVGSADAKAFASAFATGGLVPYAGYECRVVEIRYYDSPLQDDERVTGVPSTWALVKLARLNDL